MTPRGHLLISVCLSLATLSISKGQSQDNATIRLVNGSHPWEGRLELEVNGRWGPFCDMFWGPEEAEVACRQLGFNTSHVKYYRESFFGKGTLPRVWGDRYFRCTGGESTLEDCVVEYSTSCNHIPRGVAGVSCDTTQDTDDCVDHQCLHGGLCRDQNRYYTCLCANGYTGPRCQTDIDDCDIFGRTPCKNGATCQDHPGHYTCACPPEFTGQNCEVRHVLGHGSLRLVNGSHPGEGRVEILVEGTWGAICDSGWDSRDSRVVCRQLGYNTSAMEAYDNAFFGSEDIERIWTTEVDCSGNETRLVDCRARAFDSGNPCRRTKTVGVSCDATQETNDCANHQCQNDAWCRDKNRYYTCSCRPAYSGQYCQIGVTMSTGPYKDQQEDSSASFFCYSGFTPSEVSWAMIIGSGQTLDLGTCTNSGNCTSPHSPDVTVTWPRDGRSYVNFQHVRRTFGGHLFCNYTNNGLMESANTSLNVYNSGEVQNCSVAISRHNWSFVMACDVTDVFSSAGIYDFRVDQGFVVNIGVDTSYRSDSRYARGFVFEGRLSYRDILAPYVSDTDGKLYYRGRLVYSWPVPPTPGLYPDFRLVRHYGYTAFHGTYTTTRFSIATPTPPTHNCSDLNYIPETGVVPCVCTADSLGSPAGRLVWLLGNITMATGDYGVKHLKFPSGRMGRQNDGLMATCQLDWMDRRNVAVVKHVAYGPDNLSLQVIKAYDVSNRLQIHVISHVTGMKPMTSDMAQWGGLCQGQHGVTCTLTPTSAEVVNGKAVTCRVTNTANNEHSAEASVVIKLTESAEGTRDRLDAQFEPRADNHRFKPIAIGLGIALGVAIIIFVIVIIILCQRDRLCGRLSYDMMDQHTNGSANGKHSDVDMHEIMKRETNAERIGQRGGQHVNPVTRNLPVEVTREHM
ncbi:uncharacterized protein [Littorina saxatilis]|uniref:uncharacterized protein isoform X2 n=1 Tax=Littorina saxatilis TaxID=31220 RepID=UPI0038B5169B